MKQIAILISALLFAGCETVPKQPQKIIRKVVVRGDNYCRLAEIDTWSVDDTTDSIQHARRANAKYNRVCKRKPKS